MSVVINGSAGVTTNSGAVYNGISAGTAVASTSGTSIDFTSIPSWVKRITVMFNGVSTNGSSRILIQIGSGSFSTSGYLSQVSAGGVGYGATTTGFDVFVTSSGSYTFSGIVTLNLISSNTWIEEGVIAFTNVTSVCSTSAGNSSSLSGSLDRVRITTVNGTDTFDAGSINILYE